MALLRNEKFVSNLPGTLIANTIYYVKNGASIDMYVTNSTGTIVAYPVGNSNSSHDGGRASSIYGGNTILNGGDANG